jgi:hypothetical protein
MHDVGCGVMSLVIDIIFATLDARMTIHNTTKISEATHAHTFLSAIHSHQHTSHTSEIYRLSFISQMHYQTIKHLI